MKAYKRYILTILVVVCSSGYAEASWRDSWRSFVDDIKFSIKSDGEAKKAKLKEAAKEASEGMQDGKKSTGQKTGKEKSGKGSSGKSGEEGRGSVADGESLDLNLYTPDNIYDHIGKDLIVGAEKEFASIEPDSVMIRQVVEDLSGIEISSTLLSGKGGSGKSAFVYGLAKELAQPGAKAKHFPGYKDVKVVEISAEELVSGTQYVGLGAQKKAALIDRIAQDKAKGIKTILFIDEIHMLNKVAGHEGVSPMDSFKPNMANGNLSIIGATTPDEIKIHLAHDQPFMRRFISRVIRDLTREETVEILKLKARKFEEIFRVRIPDELMGEVAEFSKRFMPEMAWPGSALKVLEAVAKSKASFGLKEPLELLSLKAKLKQMAGSKRTIQSQLAKAGSGEKRAKIQEDLSAMNVKIAINLKKAKEIHELYKRQYPFSKKISAIQTKIADLADVIKKQNIFNEAPEVVKLVEEITVMKKAIKNIEEKVFQAKGKATRRQIKEWDRKIKDWEAQVNPKLSELEKLSSQSTKDLEFATRELKEQKRLLQETIDSRTAAFPDTISYGQLDIEDVKRFLYEQAGMSPELIGRTEKEIYQALEKSLRAGLRNQNGAVSGLLGRLSSRQLGISPGHLPTSYLVSGQKIQLRKTVDILSESRFGKGRKAVVVDMAEVTTVEDLFGFMKAAGDVDAGIVTSAIKDRAFSAVLFENIDAISDKKILSMIEKILEKGIITIQIGNRLEDVTFAHSELFFHSRLFSDEGVVESLSQLEGHQQFREALSVLRSSADGQENPFIGTANLANQVAEALIRVQSFIQFGRVSVDDLAELAKGPFKELADTLRMRDITLQVDPTAYRLIGETADRADGDIRVISDMINHDVATRIAETLGGFGDEIPAGFRVRANDGRLVVERL